MAAREGRLSESARRVARFLADHPDEVLFSSADELGRLTGTSDATVVRTVKSLGYPGLPALKRMLRSALRDVWSPAGRLGRSLDAAGDDPRALLGHVLDDHVRLLAQARESLDPDAFARAAELVGGARETVLFGLGGLGVLGEYAAMRLSRMRHRARVARASGFLLADALLELAEGDVLLVVAHTHVAPEAEAAIGHARRVGARVVLLTDTLGEVLGPRVDAVLCAPVGAAGTFSSQAATLAVLEALVLAVAAADRERATEAMDLLNRLRGELGGLSSTAASGPDAG